MIIYTKKGFKFDVPYLFAYDEGIWCFEFFGDLEYVDPFDGSTWYWIGYDNGVDEIIGVFINAFQLTPVESLADCIALESSFYWNDTLGIIYVHWPLFAGDWAITRTASSISLLLAGYANGYSRINQNVFDAVFYDPVIIEISDPERAVDPLALGLIAFDEFAYTLTDNANLLYQMTGRECVGDPVIMYLLEETDLALSNDKKIFVGTISGYTHSRDKIEFKIKESRFFQNTQTCPNRITIDDYANASDMVDELMPLAFGDIRRGIVIPTNNDTLDDTNPGNAVLLVADPAFGSILGIDAVYDANGVDMTAAIVATDLTACTVTVTKPAGVSPSELKEWAWEGQGYDIDGDYNNGLDIIRACFYYLAGIPFIDSLWQTIEWQVETLANPEEIGICVQSDKGFIEDIVEPICTSLQGVVEILGNGKISWASRDITEIPIVDINIIRAYDETDYPGIALDSEETVSDIQVQYSPDFVKEESLKALYEEGKDDIVADYNILRREPLSPVESVLVNYDDAYALAAELMETSAAPVRVISTEDVNILRLRLFEIIGIDTGLNKFENIEYGEVLAIKPNFNDYLQQLTVRVIPGYQPLLYVQGFGYCSDPDGNVDYGYSESSNNQVSFGYGETTYN